MPDERLEVVPVQRQAVAAGSSVDWPHIEQALGAALPRDYRDYINTYGKTKMTNRPSFYSVT